MEIIIDGIRNLTYWLSTYIYQLLIWLYDMFMRLCNSRILDAEILGIIAERLGTILGLIMLFMVMFSTIQLIIEPDKITDKEKGIGNIVKKILLVILMLGSSRIVFTGLYGLQKSIIESNIITKFILPYNVTETDEFGNILALNLFTSFYSFEEDESNAELTPEEQMCKDNLDVLKADIINNDDFSAGEECINEKNSEDKYIMNFNALLLPTVGILAAYFILSYCLSIGMRTIQLAFLEILSPMAIISYLSPKKDTMFSKWLKIYSSTYLDVFLRIMIINLVVFLIGVIFDSNLSIVFWKSVGGRQGADILIVVFIILSLLLFAKKAPDLINELIPKPASKLSKGIMSPKKMFSDMLGGNFVKGAAKVATAGAATGLLGAGISGISRYNSNRNLGKGRASALGSAIFGATSGFGRGVVAGSKKGNFIKNAGSFIKEQEKIDDKYMTLRSQGGSTLGTTASKVVDLFTETAGQKARRLLTNMQNLAKYTESAKTSADNIAYVKAAKDVWEHAVQNENESREEFIARKESYRKAYKDLQKLSIRYALSDVSDRDKLKEQFNYVTTKTITEIEKVPKTDENGTILEGQFEEREIKKVITENHNYLDDVANDFDSNLALRQIETYVGQAERYSKDNAIVYWEDKDENGKEINAYQTADQLFEDKDKLFDRFMSLGDKAKNTEYHITTQEKYGAHKANDEAAGVSDRRKPLEKK